MNSVKNFVKALRTFLDRRDPNYSGAAYEIAHTFPPEYLRDFMLLFEMTFTYYNAGAVNEENNDYADLVMISQAMLNAAHDTREIIDRM